MKKYKIEFLGDKNICLESKNKVKNKEVRLNECNEFLEFISNRGRNFFRYNDNIARFEIINDKLVYIDYYNGKFLKNTHKTGKWSRNSTCGGTLQHVIMCMSIYINSGIPFFSWHLRLSAWGYSDENSKEIKQNGLELGIITEIERYMFYLHNANNKFKIQPYLDNHTGIDKDKCIIVYSEEDKEYPYYINECNFKYIGI